jgi:hypothetical protein
MLERFSGSLKSGELIHKIRRTCAGLEHSSGVVDALPEEDCV